MKQTSLFEQESQDKGRSSTFADNLSLPIHRWFRYSAGFSAVWVKELVEQEKARGRRNVLDPFAGCGTVLLEAEFCDIDAAGIESHPFVARVARAKLHWNRDHREFRDYALATLRTARRITGTVTGYPALIGKCFPSDSLAKLDSLRKAWVLTADGSPYSELTWLALASILRECSPAGTAPWQYILPNKKKVRVVDPYAAFEAKIYLMSGDMSYRNSHSASRKSRLFQEDARACPSLEDAWADFVITSPPYANNYE